MRESFDVPLVPAAPGTRRAVRFVRYGRAEARPKAYLQAALHADEAPGLLVAHHLLRRLDAAARRGEVRGQVVVAPAANPIGLAQHLHREHLGRLDLATGRNFNRGWPEVADEVAERVAGSLGDDGEANAALIRRTAKEVLRQRPVHGELDSLQAVLAREACDSDLALDLHCDDEALMHLFAMSWQWPEAADIAGELGCRAAFVQEATGGATFAETLAALWPTLARRFSQAPLAATCLAATVELRGFADVDDDLAAADAEALVRALRRRGILAGDIGAAETSSCEATRFDACDIVRAPSAGVAVYRAGLGERVAAGAVIADVVDPAASDPAAARHAVRAATDGLVVSRRLKKVVTPGDIVAKVAGREPLAHRRGYLLED